MIYKGEERIITIPGFTLAAREWGPSDGIPTLALHGWLDNASSYEFLAPLLPDLHIVAVDSPGCGHSSHRPFGTIPSVVDEVFYMLEAAFALGWETFSLMGHSRGGAIAQMIAAGSPERIQSLVLLDIAGYYVSGSAQEGVLHLRKSVQSFLTHKKKEATLYPDLESVSKERMKASPLNYESALALVKRGTQKGENGYFWIFDRRELIFISPLRFTDEMVKGLLSGIEAPTCIIVAEDGLFKTEQRMFENVHYIKNHRIHVVPGFHHVHMDNPQVVAQHLLEFYHGF